MDEKRKGLFERLRNSLLDLLVVHGFLDGDSSEDDEENAPVGAPIRPRPHLNSGAVALDLPDEREY